MRRKAECPGEASNHAPCEACAEQIGHAHHRNGKYQIVRQRLIHAMSRMPHAKSALAEKPAGGSGPSSKEDRLCLRYRMVRPKPAETS